MMLSQMSATEVANRAPLGARTDSFAFWWLITMAALVGVMVLIGGSDAPDGKRAFDGRMAAADGHPAATERGRMAARL